MRFAYLLLFLFFTIAGTELNAQGSLCPPNIDFRTGDFRNWECRTGYVSASGGVNTVVWSNNFQVDDRQLLIAPNNTELDPYGGFPKHCPNTTTYTARLGNDNNGHEAEGLFYTYSIPATTTKFSILYYYAIVLQDPSHRPYEQPRFRARIIDVATETEIDCVSFDFASSGSLPGFRPALIGDAVYKDWTPVSVDLSSFAGKTVRLEFITSDCVFQQHFGYAYISVSSSCNGSISGGYYCEGDTSISLTAPFGFQGYSWYTDASFAQPVSNSQSLRLNAATTAIGSVVPVIVTPYPGYGCLDTLYATIGVGVKPVSRAGPDVVSCSKRPAQLGAGANEDYTYSWSPVQYVSNPGISDPFTVTTLQQPTDFIVKTTDLNTGCVSSDTVNVVPLLVDTATTITGKLIYCPGEAMQTSLRVTNPSSQVQWYNGNDRITGATTLSYQPLAVGSFWAEIKQLGCVDTSVRYVLRKTPLPHPDFIVNKEVQCLNQPVSFTNKTTVAGNEPINYLWRFADGDTSSTVNVEKTFGTLGTMTATLVTTTGTDCKDSVQKAVQIVSFCVPVLPTAFTPNNDGKNDLFTPYLVGAKKLKRFTIYNRYGNIVFTTATEGKGWDGKLKGNQQTTAVFVWVLEYLTTDDKTVTEKGTVTLLR